MSTATDEFAESGTKGYLNSGTVRRVLYALGATLTGLLVESSPAVQQWLLDIAPSFIDPYVPGALSWTLVGLGQVFGMGAIQARGRMGDLKGLYKKAP